ncbi:MAG: class I SAM-dependent methyltransferase [Actinomycetota bacterium]
MNVGEVIDRAEDILLASPSVDHWQKGRERIEAEEMLEHLLGHELDADDEVPAAIRRRFERLVARRATGEPVPQILGFVEFRNLTLKVRRGVFVPRDSSEWLVAQAVRRLRRRSGRPVAVDLATGAGPIALAVANEVRGAEVFGTDLTAESVALARENARHLEVPARFVRGDLYDGLPRRLAGKIDVITFHPPYLGRGELRELPDEIRKFEPASSLTDRSPTGMFLIERAAIESEEWLRPGGWLLVEVAPDRSRAVASLIRRCGFRDVKSTKDPTTRLDVSRVIAGRR